MDCFVTDYGVRGADAVALEDCIMQKDAPAAAGSPILKGFISPLDATVVSRLKQNGMSIAGRTTMDEFGISGSDVLSGAVKAVADGLVPFALGNDVFGKLRRQAAENGVCYIHPTYGTVSRYGLIPLASSMDQIGIVCRDLTDGFKLLSVIAGKDAGDGAMFPETSYKYEADRRVRVAVASNVPDKSGFAGKFETVEIELEYLDALRQTFCILACAEISNNINRYDGIKFGYRTPNYKGLNDIYVNTRTEAFGLDVKLAAVMGSFVLSHGQYVRYYEKAMKLRRLIKNSLRFDTYDVIALPDDSNLYSIAPLAGLPSVTFSHNGHGIQLIANVRNENALLGAWEVSRT